MTPEKIKAEIASGEADCASVRLELRIKLNEIADGEIIKLVSTNPETQKGIPRWCRMTGHELFLSDEKDDSYIFYIKKRIKED
jgi:tRNA 2-thiouridine synthesizing protein A